MKKKLLTILLAALMVFGMFNLAACGPQTNPANDYNYFSSVYGTLNGTPSSEIKIEQMTYNGIYNLFKTPGQFLVYWGGYYDDATQANIKAVNDVANEYGVTVYNFDPNLDAKIGNQANEAVYNTASADLSDRNIASVSVSMGELRASLLAVMKENSIPSQGSLSLVRGAAPSVEIKDGDVKETFKGSVVTKSNDVEQFESIVQAGCIKKPSYSENGQSDAAGFDTATINTFNLFNDYRLHMAGDYATATSAFTDAKNDVYVTTTYHGFLDLLTKSKGYYAVLFGGTWCHNTQAVAQATNELAKEYGIDKIYSYDPRLDNGATRDVYEIVDEIVEGEFHYNPDTGMITPKTQKAIKTHYDQTMSGTPNYMASKLNTRSTEVLDAAGRTYSHLYARLLDTCLPTYTSIWNDPSVESNMLKIKGAKESYTMMCVPNVMMFNGDLAQKDRLIAFAEAEYEWGYAPYAEQWKNALHRIFKMNKFAAYNPPVVETPAETPPTGGSTGGSGGGGTTLPPAGGAC